MEIKKRDNDHGVPVYDLIGLTEGKMLAILHALETADSTMERHLTPVQHDVWTAISRALGKEKP